MTIHAETFANAQRASLFDGLSGAPVAQAATRWKATQPQPWFGWLLLCLMRQIPRQQWLVRIVHERLHTAPRDSSDVPGLPGWTYYFHGIGCCLKSPDGEAIDVDFHDEQGFTIDPYFFARRVFSLENPPFPEARLQVLLPTVDLIAHAIRELVDADELLRPIDEYHHAFRLAEDLEARAVAPAHIDFDAPDEQYRWAMHIGDFEAVAAFRAEFDSLAQDARTWRIRWLLQVLQSEHSPHAALGPLAHLLAPEDFVDVCKTILECGPIGPLTGRTIETLDALEGNLGADAVVALLPRLDPEEHHPFTAVRAANYLLQRDLAKEQALEVVFAFGRIEKVKGYIGNPFGADFANLAIQYAPDRCLELVRKALNDSTPITRLTILSTLSSLDQPWCHGEIALALQGKDDPDDAAPFLEVLMESNSTAAREIAERWSKAHPPKASEEDVPEE